MTTDHKNPHPGIRRVTTSKGEVRYRLVIDMGGPTANVINAARPLPDSPMPKPDSRGSRILGEGHIGPTHQDHV
jgi:hypothetical protein